MREIGGLFAPVPGPSYRWEAPEIVRKEQEVAADHNEGVKYYKSLNKPFIIMQRLYKYRRILTFVSIFFFTLNMTGSAFLLVHGHREMIYLWLIVTVSWFLSSDSPKKIADYIFWWRIGRQFHIKH